MLAYSSRNRSASCRIRTNSPNGSVEVRFPDAANLYLAFSAMLMAGLDGIKIHPGDAMDKDLYDLPAEELPRSRPSAAAPRALDLSADRGFLSRAAFTDDQIDAYIELKMEEVIALEHPPGRVPDVLLGQGSSSGHRKHTKPRVETPGVYFNPQSPGR